MLITKIPTLMNYVTISREIKILHVKETDFYRLQLEQYKYLS